MRVHRGDCRDVHLAGQTADFATGQPVPSGIERGTGHDHGRPMLLERRAHTGQSGVALLAHVVVAANDRRDDLCLIAQGLLKRSSRAKQLRLHLNSCVGCLLAAKAAEKLVDEVHDAYGVHRCPRRNGYAGRGCRVAHRQGS